MGRPPPPIGLRIFSVCRVFRYKRHIVHCLRADKLPPPLLMWAHSVIPWSKYVYFIPITIYVTVLD